MPGTLEHDVRKLIERYRGAADTATVRLLLLLENALLLDSRVTYETRDWRKK